MMDIFFNWIDQRNYRVCLDWDVRSLESLAERNPVLTSKLRRYLSENKIEVINGGYSQHYPHYWSPQATIQNLKYGRKVFKKIFGQTVTTFGGQECCMNPQMPNFLGKSGYQYALHRIQNFGHVPLVKENLMSWKGMDGTLIKAIPGNPSASERIGSIFYLLLAFKIHQSIEMGIKDPVLTNLQDFGNVAFREEVCRIAFYAPIFGRHSTIKDCFIGKGKLPVKSFDYYDYQYGYFYAGSVRCDENDDFTRAFRLERVLTDAQLVNGLAAFNQKSNPRTWWPYWDLLFAFQSHDVLIASDGYMGSFFHDMGGPLDVSLKRNTRIRPLGERFIHNCRNYIHQTLQKTLKSKGEYHGVFNTLGFARRVQVRDRQGQSGSINVPAWGVASRLEPLEGDIAVTNHTVENSFIRLNINPTSGFIQGVVDKQTGQEVICRCNEFVYGEDSVMRMDNCQLIEHTSCNTKLRVKGAITLKKDIISWYATDITLNAQSRLINCRARFYPVISMPSNPCDHAIHHRVWITAKRPGVITSYLNINAPLREGEIHRQFKRFKPYTFPLFARPSDPKLKMFDSPWYVRLVSARNTVDLYNNGPQWYYLKGNTIRQHLVAGKESCLEYHYAIAVNNTVRHPLLSSLDWQTPVYPVNVESRESWSLFTIIADNLVPFGCEYIGNDTFLFRVMEIEGRKTKSEVLCACPVKEAVETDYLGVPQRTLFKKKNRFICNLPPWGISEFHVRLNNKALPGFSR
ncbi:MAG: hypothetical protein L6437_12720 [Kiritimatiellae bacterium]|nr:hypothetical protein [Kiritimatiellia bacterium]